MFSEFQIHQALQQHQAGNWNEAERLYLLALENNRESVDALHMLGVLRLQQERNVEALHYIEAAIELNSRNAAIHFDHGNLLYTMGHFDRALASYGKALSINPCHAGTLNNRAVVLRELNRFAEALESAKKSIAIEPRFADAQTNLGLLMGDEERWQEALAHHERALALQPHHAGALFNRGAALRALKNTNAAQASFDRAFAIDPDYPFLRDAMAATALQLCDWPRTKAISGKLPDFAAGKQAGMRPFTLMGYSDDPSLQYRCAKAYCAEVKAPMSDRKTYGHERLRVAYLSADFGNKLVGLHIAELLEMHDRERFEIFGISFGIDDKSEMRARLMKAVDHFHDVRLLSDFDVARLLRILEIDIAIDLGGHTTGARLDILSYRPCPVQVSYLGYAGTTGAKFMDYVLADPVAAPKDIQPFFAEEIVHVKGCYLPKKASREKLKKRLERRDVGVPEDAFIFCCFNNSAKITEQIFDIWVRLLKAVPHSVLWLKRFDAAAENNIKAEAAKRGLTEARLVFELHKDLYDYLARCGLANLFLDTFPFTAHSTASDVLFAGLPLVTCRGRSFSSRVSASLLHAAGLPELVTKDLASYEALALKLALEPKLLESFRRRLTTLQESDAFFDSLSLCREIESAYLKMSRRLQTPAQPVRYSRHG